MRLPGSVWDEGLGPTDLEGEGQMHLCQEPVAPPTVEWGL